MAKEQIQSNFGKEFFGWQVPEYEKHMRTKRWYFAASSVILLLLLYAFYAANFLFAIILVVGALILFLNDAQNPALVRFSITSEGVIIGRKFYEFNEIKSFGIVYKPNIDIKNLYFEFKSPVRHRLSVPLLDMNPLPIRENLLKYLPEDLERTDPPLSEQLSRLLKL